MQFNIFCRHVICLIFVLSITCVAHAEKVKGGLLIPYHAPTLSSVTEWINSEPLKTNELKGKVVLIAFWNYSCAPCMQTLPYLKEWYSEYENKGLVIIGVHEPEFSFQKEFDNVKNQVEKMGITYPVVLDNELAISKSFNNHHVPTYYLINKEGYVVYSYHGVGNAIFIENNIRYLLGLKPILAPVIPRENSNAESVSVTSQIHLGYENDDLFLSPESIQKEAVKAYSFPKQLSLNEWALKGNWKIMSDHVTSDEEQAVFEFNVKAKKMNVIMGSTTGQPISVNIVLNNKLLKTITVSDHAFYNVIQNNHPENGLLQMISAEPGLEIYSITVD